MTRPLFFYSARSADNMVRQCQNLQTVGLSGEWLFRGQANTDWAVDPSLLRRTSPIANPRDFERRLLLRLRAVLAERTVLPGRLLADDNYLLAFAQHYGVPTRLTDWTKDPLIALYFAASGALREPKIGSFSVFGMAEIYVIGEDRGELVTPHYAGNRNLAAQRGRFLKHEWERPDLLDGTAPEETFEPPFARVDDLIDSRLFRLDLPAAFAGAVLTRLRKGGQDAGWIYPSEHGLARLAEDLALTPEPRSTPFDAEPQEPGFPADE